MSASVRGRKTARADAGDCRARILEEATRHFVEGGYHRISMREIAESVGVSKAGIYYYFADKESLFLAILTAALDELEDLLASAAGRPTTRERIRHLLEGIMGWPPERRALVRLAGQEVDQLGPEARRAFGRAYRDRFVRPLEAILREGVERGELRSLDERFGTWVLLGMIYPFTHPSRERALPNPAATAEALERIFLDGAAPHEGGGEGHSGEAGAAASRGSRPPEGG